MNEFTPHYAPIVVLLFLGSAFLLGVSLLVLAYSALRRSRVLAIFGAGLAALFAGGYAFLLFGAALLSHEKIVPQGAWKYFCEIDCHIAYSIEDVQTATAHGRETQKLSAQGQFVMIRLKTWFDERTISPHRGNSPLGAGNRLVTLLDQAGHAYFPSSRAQAALGLASSDSVSLNQPLRPGESFTTTLVFDIPQSARNLRLLVADPADDWLGRMIVGHESSPLHEKIYLATPLPASSAHAL